MGKITGAEAPQDVPAKVKLLYDAVVALIAEDVDVNAISVATITEKAGIGKGTAYEYFDSKDEILAYAIIYYTQWAYEKVVEWLEEEPSFSRQIERIFDEMQKGSPINCQGMRYVHLLTDHSNLSKMIMEKMREEPLCHFLPGALLEKMLRDGIERGEVRDDLPMDYMVNALLSKLIAYILCLNPNGIMHVDIEKIRPFVYQSLLDELCKKNI